MSSSRSASSAVRLLVLAFGRRDAPSLELVCCLLAGGVVDHMLRRARRQHVTVLEQNPTSSTHTLSWLVRLDVVHICFVVCERREIHTLRVWASDLCWSFIVIVMSKIAVRASSLVDRSPEMCPSSTLVRKASIAKRAGVADHKLRFTKDGSVLLGCSSVHV